MDPAGGAAAEKDKEESDEDNRALYGKCNNPHGHGHNYKITVTVRGPLNPVTGMVLNLVDLKKAMHETVVDVFDHKHIDLDVPHFKDVPSTAENICVFAWNELKLSIAAPAELYEVRVDETDKNTA
eukprot:CAMPEP_0206329416 /NCGR_PEP_ID=MMETSP0106_2-20121207/23186_1 /ASSEMBLY_ACC=CAM_ASM_000206 /TAXON_ID=81532 /ORGANISM="Acanthoeca-like sp., Strain 10tr" /LENGTH=125 /DNA_ID=CAMNT_0053762131 /DNA_START=168 /DNA_END=542 /DNA_ORIENTATION=+